MWQDHPTEMATALELHDGVVQSAVNRAARVMDETQSQSVEAIFSLFSGYGKLILGDFEKAASTSRRGAWPPPTSAPRSMRTFAFSY